MAASRFQHECAFAQGTARCVMEPTERNRRAWDEVHRRRAQAMAGGLGLPAVVRAALGDLMGRHVLHLQCATGESTAELAGMGALVTGVDLSGEALDVARERWPDIAWVQADVQSLPSELRRARFDLVYTADGVLAWLTDLGAWATGIAAALRRGGDFLLHEEHPASESWRSLPSKVPGKYTLLARKP